MTRQTTTRKQQLAAGWRECVRELIAFSIKRAQLERDRAAQRRHSDNALLLLGLMAADDDA